MKRRDFLGSLGASGFAWGAATEPELVLLNGNVHTVDAASPHAEAVAIAGGTAPYNTIFFPVTNLGVFSGKSLSALRAIRTGVGPLRLDAMGHCGKGGQSVPSSGGSHLFLVLDAHPDVQIGGSV